MNNNECKNMAQISSFKNKFDTGKQEIQEIFFETNEKEIFSFLVKPKNFGYFFGNYIVMYPEDQPKIGDEIFFLQYKHINNNRIISFLSKQKFDNSQIPSCHENKNIGTICIVIILIIIGFGIIFKKFFKK